jgi:putative SOS response-associated peptidase YedK
MGPKPTPFDTEAPLGDSRAIIRRNPDDLQELEMIEATWGSNPRFTDGVNYRFVRSEGQSFPINRCLLAASEFRMEVNGKRYRVELDTGSHFYLAGIWEPAMGDWSVCFRIVTVYAGADICDYQQRHGALIVPRQVMQWLDGTVPVADLLTMQPARTFRVEAIGKSVRQSQLAL